MTRCMIIGEVGNTHEGSLGLAHSFIDAIADAGAGAVKFQCHIASAESSKFEPWRVKFSDQDETRYDYWKRMEFTENQWRGLRAHSHAKGLKFICSPFSTEALQLLERVGVDYWKVASGETNNHELLMMMRDTGWPILLSTGMSTEKEVLRGRHLLSPSPVTVMQCTSVYPCPPEKLGLNVLRGMKEQYHNVGLSDHTGTIYSGLAAATMGIHALEVHVTLSREMFGPDVAASITTAELRQLVEGVRFIEAAIDNPIDKDEMAGELGPLRDIFTKSVVAKTARKAGQTIPRSMLTVKKPGWGIPGHDIDEIAGRRLARDVEVNQPICASDLEIE